MTPQVFEFDYDETNDILYLGFTECAKDDSYGDELCPSIVVFKQINTEEEQGILIFSARKNKKYNKHLLSKNGFEIDIDQFINSDE